MSRYGVWVSVLVVGLVPPLGRADPGAKGKPLATPTGLAALRVGSSDSLAGSLRGFLLESFPNPLYEANPGWGKTKSVLTGFKARGKGLHVHLDGKYEQRNHGTWRGLRVIARNLPGTLAVDVRDVKKLDRDRTTFTVVVGFDAQVEYRRQQWASGVRLYDASARARVRVKLALQCESVLRVEKTNGLLPDAVFRLRVLQADLRYDNLVCEHIAGFGGSPAKVVGDLVGSSLKKYHPSLERKLLARANAAIVKAGDTKEIRIGLGKLLTAGD